MTDEQERWSVNRGTNGMAPEGSSERSANLWARMAAPKGGSEPHSILRRMGGGEAGDRDFSEPHGSSHSSLFFIVGLKMGRAT